MRGTLSQRGRPPERGRPPTEWPDPTSLRRPTARLRRTAASLAALALLACPIACDRAPEHSSESTPRVTAVGNEVLGDATEFAWPKDPSHPVLEIAVSWPGSTGRILVELIPELAPATVAEVIALANDGFYDGTTFHRVIPGFMIQGGDPSSRDRDPSNDGRGAPGASLHDEFGPAPFLRGVVGMGNKGRENSTSTQFFVMHADNPDLRGRYTVIGRVLHGMDLVDEITQVAIDRNGRWGPKDRPIENVVMSRVRTIGKLAEVRSTLEPDEGPSPSSRFVAADAEEPGQVTGAPEAEGAPPASAHPSHAWERRSSSAR